MPQLEFKPKIPALERSLIARSFWFNFAGFCEHGNELSGSTKAEFLEQLRNYQILKKDFAAWS
jgi:hypothetical protein